MRLMHEASCHASAGTRISEALLAEILHHAPDDFCQQSPKLIVEHLQPLLRFCDWDLFGTASILLQQGLCLESINQELLMRAKSFEEISEREDFRKSEEKVIEAYGCMLKEPRERMGKRRDLEVYSGFDQKAVDLLMERIGRSDPARHPRELQEMLPKELTWYWQHRLETDRYDHRLHLLLKNLLVRIGTSGRGSRAVVKFCGHILENLEPRSYESWEVPITVQQATYLADDYLIAIRNDLIVHCWRGELACWARDDDLAAEFAQGVLEKATGADVPVLSTLISFLGALDSESWDQQGWVDFDHPTHHFGQVRIELALVEATLLDAIVHRALQELNSDVRILQAVSGLGFSLPRRESISPEGWIWVAERSAERVDFGDELYQECWSNALATMDRRTDPVLYKSAIVVLLLFELFDGPRCIRHGIPSLLGKTTEQVMLHGSRSHYEPIVGLAMGVRMKRGASMPRADHEAILLAFKWLHPSASPRAGEWYRANLELVGSELEQLLGSRIWSRLSSATKEHLERGELFFACEKTFEGETGSFESPVMSFSKGLLAEFRSTLWDQLLKIQGGKKIKGELCRLFGNRSPAWRELTEFLDRVKKDEIDDDIVSKLVKRGIRVDKLIDLKSEFEKIKELRNKAAHAAERIDREEACLFHGRLLNSGLMRKVFSYLHR